MIGCVHTMRIDLILESTALGKHLPKQGRSGEAYPETPLWVLGRAWASVRLFAENNLNFV